jgi:hypothetical protein
MQRSYAVSKSIMISVAKYYRRKKLKLAYIIMIIIIILISTSNKAGIVLILRSQNLQCSSEMNPSATIMDIMIMRGMNLINIHEVYNFGITLIH